MADQEIRLGLKTDIPEKAGEARKAMSDFKGSIDDLIGSASKAIPVEDGVTDSMLLAAAAANEAAKSHEVLTSQINQADAAMDKLVADAVEATRAQRALSQAVEETSTATSHTVSASANAAAGVRGYQQNITGLGYAMNDFLSVQGDMGQRLNAIANNIPQLLAGFGGLGLALGAIVPVAALVIQHWDKISEFFGDTTLKAPQAADALQRLKDELGQVSKELETLKEKQSLSFEEFDRANMLTERQVELQQQVTEEMTRQQEIERLRSLRSREATETGEGVRKAIAESGGYDSVVGQVEAALSNVAAQTGQDVDPAVVRAQAEQLVRDAAGGDKTARDTMRRAVEQGLEKTDRNQKLAQNLTEYSPEGQAAADAAYEAEVERDRAIERSGKAAARSSKAAADNAEERAYQEEVAKDEAIAESGRAITRGQAARDRAAKKAKAERKRDAAAAGRTVTPEQLYEQQLAMMARQQEPGLTEGQAEGVARETAQLQRQGLNLNTAMAAAMAETQALLAGNAEQYQWLRSQIEQMVQNNREIRSTFLRRGGR